MQKISSYLYPNRIFVVADLASHITEWNIVYQRTLKIYKGLDNVIEFDFKNAQQRRIDISAYDIKCIVMEQNNIEIYTADVVPVLSKTGIASAVIPKNILESVAPQFLKYALYIEVNDSSLTRIPVYADTQFGVTGQMELIGGIFPTGPAPKIIDTFLYTVNDSNPSQLIKTYFSESVEVKPLNDVNDSTVIGLDFEFSNLEGSVTVQLTTAEVVSTGTIWRDIEVFDVVPSTTTLYKLYREAINYTNTVGWLRVKYSSAANTTGTIDRIKVIL